MSNQLIPNPRRQPHAVDYAARVLLNESGKAGNASAMPVLPGDISEGQQPLDVKVPTVSNYQPRDVKADDK